MFTVSAISKALNNGIQYSEYPKPEPNVVLVDSTVADVKLEILDISRNSPPVTPQSEARLNKTQTPVTDYVNHAPYFYYPGFAYGFAHHSPTPLPFVPYDPATGGYVYMQPTPMPVDTSSLHVETKSMRNNNEETFECQSCNQTKKYSVFVKDEMYCLPCAEKIKADCRELDVSKEFVEGKLVMRVTRRSRGVIPEPALHSRFSAMKFPEMKKSFSCAICNQERERKHYLGEKLCCRSCYHKEKPTNGEKQCENCNVKSEKSYYRSKFAERLCHNCFHYKLRTGAARPL